MFVFVTQKKRKSPEKTLIAKSRSFLKLLPFSYVQFPQLAFFVPFLERAFVKLVQTKDELKFFLIQQILKPCIMHAARQNDLCGPQRPLNEQANQNN